MPTVKECRLLLNINTRKTINQYLKFFDFFGQETLTWDEFRRLLELQAFLGLKAGINSKLEFFTYSPSELDEMFKNNSVNIEEKLKNLQQKYANYSVKIAKKSKSQKPKEKAILSFGSVARNSDVF